MKNKLMAFLLVAIMLMATCSVSATKYVASTVSPYKITAETGKTGNIFFEREAIKFDITVEDLIGKYPASAYDYTVKTYLGETVKTGSASVTDGKSTLALTGIPYGGTKIYYYPHNKSKYIVKNKQKIKKHLTLMH